MGKPAQKDVLQTSNCIKLQKGETYDSLKKQRGEDIDIYNIKKKYLKTMAGQCEQI